MQGLVDDYGGLVEGLNQNLSESQRGYIFQAFHGYQVGSYLSLQRSRSISRSGQHDETHTLLLCLDDKFRQVNLADLFARDFNYEIVIKTFLENQMRNQGYRGPHTIDEVYSDLQFKLEISAITFCTDRVTISERERRPIEFAIPFAAFGCDNMTIFKD